MRFNDYLHEQNAINESVFSNALSKIKNKPLNAVKSLFKDSWEKFANLLKAKGLEKDALRIINRHMGTRYNSLDQISKGKVQENIELNEDFAHWWKKIKEEAFPTLAFYPALSVWLELDKLFSGGDPNWPKVGAYATFFLLLVSGKYLKSWAQWSKDNPDEKEKQEMEAKQQKGINKVRHMFRSV